MPSSVSHYDQMKVIGEGTYGVVYRARDSRTQDIVALKRIYLDDSDDGLSATTLREIGLLKMMRHRNVVTLRDLFFDDDHGRNRNGYGHQSAVYLVFECCKGDLKQYLTKLVRRSPLKMGKIKKLSFQIMSGIAYCHSIGIMHRDIKPQNILINYKTEEIRITDFGLSRTFVLPMRSWTHEVVTLWYRPPEVLMGAASYSLSVDIWSIGCVIAEMLNNNRPLFSGQSEISQLLAMFQVVGSPKEANWPGVSTQCKDWHSLFPNWTPKSISNVVPRSDLDRNGQNLLRELLRLVPNHRITAKDALSHPWFHCDDDREVGIAGS